MGNKKQETGRQDEIREVMQQYLTDGFMKHVRNITHQMVMESLGIFNESGNRNYLEVLERAQKLVNKRYETVCGEVRRDLQYGSLVEALRKGYLPDEIDSVLPRSCEILTAVINLL